MIIDCDTCQVRGAACGDCVIGVLMGAPDTAEAVRRWLRGRPNGVRRSDTTRMSLLHLACTSPRGSDQSADRGKCSNPTASPPLR